MPNPISEIAAKRSRRTFSSAFQVACIAAASNTAKNTVAVTLRGPVVLP